MTPAAIITLTTIVSELLISLLMLGGGLYVLLYAQDPAVKQSAAVLIGAVAAFWFQRRSGDTVATLANGKLSDLITQQASTNAKLSELSGAASVAAAVNMGASSSR